MLTTSCKKEDEKCKVETKFDGIWIEPAYPDETITISGNTITITDGYGYVENVLWTLSTCEKNTFSGTFSGVGFNEVVHGVFLDDNTLELTISGDTVTLYRV